MTCQTIHDPERIDALKRLRLIGNPISENPFARIVETVSELFDMPNVAIHLLDGENQWVKALVGDRFECRVEDSFCAHALVREAELWVIPDTRGHEIFSEHPLTLAGRIRFYAAATLVTSEGHRIGTLCLTDPHTRPDLADTQKYLLTQFARIIVDTMDLRKDFHEVANALTTVTELDGITGLRNTSSFMTWALRMRDSADSGSRLGVIRVQLGQTATIKQSSGEAGLNHLRHDLARRLDGDLRENEVLVSARDGDFLFARYFQNGGDEAGKQQIREWVCRRCSDVDKALLEPFSIDGSDFFVTARYGLASLQIADIEPAWALDATSMAAEKAGKSGADNGVWYCPEMSEAARFLVRAEDRLRKAVELRRFKVAFQPVMALGNGGPVLCGAEALLRWQEPGKPVIGPDVFIPMAEQNGLIDEIGLWVFEEACTTLAGWGERCPIWISVNISPLQLNDTSLPEKFADIAARAGIPPGRVKLEITESALSGNFEYVRQMLFRFRQVGFVLALDDFGTGYSSLTRVINLPFDFIKVDRAFVSDAPGGPGAAVVASVSQMTAELGMEPIAEGVETQEQEQFLLAKGYRLVQGYRYARPMFSDDFETWVGSGSSAASQRG